MLVVFNVLWIFFVFDVIDAYSSHLCQSLNLRNGKVKYLNRGKTAKFTCFKPYSLIGNSAVECYNREWDGALPICAKKNCDRFPKLVHGKITYYNDAAIAKAYCDPDFTLIGSRYMYCDLAGWNDTFPACQADSLNQFGTCNYEPDGTQQCEWFSKPVLFNWTVMSSYRDENDHMPAGSYPEHDHSMTPHTGGHFLYLETLFSPSKTSLQIMRTQNAAAKYISPLFPAILDNTEMYCLIFYLYTNGQHVGAVEVFIGDESAWKNNASLGNEWHKVLIPLRIQPHPFRVIYLLELAYKYLYELNPSDNANYSITIEGISELGYFTNTAIDDLKIVSGEECREDIQKAAVLPVDVEGSTQFRVIASTQAVTEQNHYTTPANNSQNAISLTNPARTTTEEFKTEPTTIQRITSTSNQSINLTNDVQKPYIESHAPVASAVSEKSQFTEFKTTILPASPKPELSEPIPIHSGIQSTKSNSVYHKLSEKNATGSFTTEPPSRTHHDHVHDDDNDLIESTFRYKHDDVQYNENYLNVQTTTNQASRINQTSHTNQLTESPVNTHFIIRLSSNDTTVEPNNTKYEYNYHEEKERNDPKQEGNDEHFEITGKDLETNHNHVELDERENDRKSGLVAKFFESKQSHEDNGIMWIILSTLTCGLLLILITSTFILVLRKYHQRCRNTNKDESSIQFFKQDNIPGSTSKRDDVLVINCGAQNFS